MKNNFNNLIFRKTSIISVKFHFERLNFRNKIYKLKFHVGMEVTFASEEILKK